MIGLLCRGTFSIAKLHVFSLAVVSSGTLKVAIEHVKAITVRECQHFVYTIGTLATTTGTIVMQMTPARVDPLLKPSKAQTRIQNPKGTVHTEV
jgi:hypothetical protein